MSSSIVETADPIVESYDLSDVASDEIEKAFNESAVASLKQVRNSSEQCHEIFQILNGDDDPSTKDLHMTNYRMAYGNEFCNIKGRVPTLSEWKNLLPDVLK